MATLSRKESWEIDKSQRSKSYLQYYTSQPETNGPQQSENQLARPQPVELYLHHHRAPIYKCTRMARKKHRTIAVSIRCDVNVMSLAPKVDEVSHVVQNANYDLVCITESWLRQHVPDSVRAINGYKIIRRHRKEATHGGVCTYIKVTIPFSRSRSFRGRQNSGFRSLVGKAVTTSTPWRLFQYYI